MITKIRATKEHISMKLINENSFKKYGIKYFTNDKQNTSVFLNFLILLILFFSPNAKLIEYNDYSHSSLFSVKVKGKGVKYFLNKDYGSSPSSVYINNEYQNDPQKFYNFTESLNTVKFYISSNSFEKMFKGLESITEINILNYDNSAYNINRMFEGCKNLVKANLRNIYTNSYLQCDYLFKGCVKLSDLTIISRQITVGSMEGMFYNCQALASIGYINFNTNNVRIMDNLKFLVVQN